MKALFSILLVMLIVFVAAPSLAQDEESTCAPENFADLFAEITPQILDGSLIETEQDAFDALLGFQMLIETIRAQCSGGSFSNETHPNGIIGPILFGGTLYQATLVGDGSSAALTGTPIEGDCDIMPPFIGTAFEGGDETDLWEFGGDCMMMFEVNAPGVWTLDIQRLR